MQNGQPVREQATREVRYDDASVMPPPRSASRAPARRRGMAPLRSILLIGLLILAGALAVMAGMGFNAAKKIAGKENPLSVIESIRDPRGRFPGVNRVNILLVGTDYDYIWPGHNSKLNGARTSKGTRSDTIAMVSLDLDHEHVSMLSVPRDTLVRAPEELGSSEMVEGKINGTYKRGGYPLLSQAVNNLLGVKPDFYISVKPDALKNIVDTLGGVEVETLDRLKYIDSAADLNIDLPKGKQIIDGKEAIGFARFREADIIKRTPDGKPIPLPGSHTEFYHKPHSEIIHSIEEGEPRRMARQQQLIRAMARKAQSFENLFKLDDLVNKGLEQVDTNMERTQIFALVALFRSIKPEQIQSGTLKGKGGRSGASNLYFFHPDEEKKKLMVDWLLHGDQTAGNRLTLVEVQNGTDVTGAANRFAEKLKAEGFDVRATSNANRGEGGNEFEKTKVIYHTAAMAQRAENVAKIIGGAQVVKEPRLDPVGVNGFDDEPVDVTVILGRDLASAPQGTKVAL